MENHELKYAVVVRMFRDKIYVGKQHADVETVVRYANVERCDEGDAKDLLEGEMVDNDDCPVEKVGDGMVAIRDDDEVIIEYLESLEAEMDLPWKLR